MHGADPVARDFGLEIEGTSKTAGAGSSRPVSTAALVQFVEGRCGGEAADWFHLC